jgi:ketosteroid isomerase-like protein
MASLRETMETFFECFGAGDLPGCALLLREDAVVHEPAGLPYRGEYVRPAGFEEVIGKLLAEFDVAINDVEQVDAGERLIALIDADFTHRASGAHAPMRVVEIHSIADGRSSGVDVYYWDSATIATLATATPA